ncbi:MAG: hypothetical protein C4320_07980 [Armatimonadota bacterium]
MPYTVIGIFDNQRFKQITDLDNEFLTPVDFILMQKMSQQSGGGGGGGSSEAFKDYQHLEPNTVAIIPYETLINQGGEVRSVAIDFLSPDESEAESRRILSFAVRYASALRSAGRGEKDDALQMANASLQFALRRFESLFQGLPAACFTLDREGMIHEWNAAATRLFRTEAYLATYQYASDVFGTEWTPEAIASKLAAGGHFEWQWKAPGGRKVWMEGRLLPILGPENLPNSIVVTNLDVTERVSAQRRVQAYAKKLERQAAKLERANGDLEARSLTDALTGLGNRRRFDEVLDLAVERGRRNGTSFSLILLDLDRFKGINDDFGHDAGDEVLRAAARVLRSTARKLEPPMRLGGEEFALILENCLGDSATKVAERIQQKMRTTPWPHRMMTASIGIGEWREGDTPGMVYRRADEALYRAKSEGRNCLRRAA